VIYATDPIEAVTGADALVVVTEWNLFRAVAPARLKALMRGTVIVDLRNIFDPAAIRAAGFAYHAIGRALPPVEEAARRGAA
jgi:UDPglucose 6-dehydrogenase